MLPKPISLKFHQCVSTFSLACLGCGSVYLVTCSYFLQMSCISVTLCPSGEELLNRQWNPYLGMNPCHRLLAGKHTVAGFATLAREADTFTTFAGAPRTMGCNTPTHHPAELCRNSVNQYTIYANKRQLTIEISEDQTKSKIEMRKASNVQIHAENDMRETSDVQECLVALRLKCPLVNEQSPGSKIKTCYVVSQEFYFIAKTLVDDIILHWTLFHGFFIQRIMCPKGLFSAKHIRAKKNNTVFFLIAKLCLV